MAKNSIEAYGAEGKSNLLMFDPAALHIVTDEAHPLYDPRAHDPVDAMLVASIKMKGVVEPGIVWKDPETGKTCVVDGRGRVRANRVANAELAREKQPIKMMPCIVSKGDAKAAMATMIVANEGRREPTALGRAQMAKRLVEAGYTETQTATLLHVSPSTVRNSMTLLSATAVVRKATDSGKIPVSMAYKLAKLEPEEQRTQLATMLEAGGEAPTGPKGTRARSKKMREAVGERSARRKPELEAKLAELECLATPPDGWIDALRWALGRDVAAAEDAAQ